MIKNIISVIYSLIKFSLIKIVKGKRFRFKVVERFSPNTEIKIGKKSEIILGNKVRAHSRSILRSINGGKIELQDNVALNNGCGLYSMKEIIIGEGTMLGPNVLVYDHDHDYKTKGGIRENKFTLDGVRIGKNVWIGANSIILKGTEIGDNSVIGAGSIIKGKYPSNSLIIQKRNTECYAIKKEKIDE